MKKIIVSILIVVLTASSCSNDFTDLSSENALNTGDFYKTKDDFNAGVLAIYSKLQGQVNIYFELVEYRSDNLDLSAPTSGTVDRYDITKFKETSANGLIQDAWSNFYNGIFRANVIIDKIGNANFDANLKKQYEGEARFIRALTYFNIVRFWGDAPLVLKEITVAESLTTGRTPASKVYEAIEEDLKFAAANLPSSYSSSDFGRATSGAAKALLGKVYLTEKKYSETVTVLNEIMGKYSLQADISNVFNTSNKTNNEIIFSIRYNKDLIGEGHGLWFGISDVSTSNFTSKLVTNYKVNDTRKPLIDYKKIGNQFVPGKFYDTQSTTTLNYGNDYILLRHADVLLMLAEALNEQSYQATGQALDNLNAVRIRASLPKLTAVDVPNQASFRKAVLNERFSEFPLEGQRWFDLVRTNTAQQEINSAKGISIQAYQLLYPVPQVEIEKINNKTIFYQNEGY